MSLLYCVFNTRSDLKHKTNWIKGVSFSFMAGLFIFFPTFYVLHMSHTRVVSMVILILYVKLHHAHHATPPFIIAVTTYQTPCYIYV